MPQESLTGVSGDAETDDRVRQIDVSTLQERVYQELRNALYQGRFLPGDAVTIRSLAKALGTSPMPVREAMQRLVAEQALVQLPNRTIRVPALTLKAFYEVMRIRTVVEGYAAERAAQRRTPALVQRLRAINADFAKAVEAADAPGMLGRNQQFHFAVYKGSQSDELLKIIESLWLRFGPIIALERDLSGSIAMFKRGVRAHERIIDAIEQRNSRGARFAMALDIRAAAAWLRHNHDFDATASAPRKALEKLSIGL
jgi:DNA-binding GntR family transcriptional regulator